MYKRNATLIFAICFLGGIFVSAFAVFGDIYKFLPVFYVSQYYVLGFLILGIIVAQILGGLGFTRLLVLMLLFITAFFMGIIAHQNVSNSRIKDGVNHISRYNDTEKVTFLGKVADYPDLRISNTKYTVEVLEIVDEENAKVLTSVSTQVSTNVHGKVLLTTNRYPSYEYGDILEITGQLKTPVEFPDFNYKDYLFKDGIYSVIYYAEVKKVGEAQGLADRFWKNIFSFKTKLRESFYKIFPVPHSTILSAMVLGDKRLMSDELKNKLSVTGMRHIVAISGMHIFILIKIFETIGFRVGLWRKHVFYFTFFAITLYILMIGAPASAIRAGIMGIILLFAGNIGRVNDPKRIIIFAAAGMLALNPLLLKLDIGFQLSFLAVMGIMYLEPCFEKWLKFLPKDVFSKYFPVRSLAAMTFAAQTATLPIVIYNFGIISFISPIINVLVVPLLTFIMPFAIIAGLGGILFANIFIYLSWPLYIILSYVIFMVDLFSKIPLGFIQMQGDITFLWFIPWYILIFVFVRKYKLDN